MGEIASSGQLRASFLRWAIVTVPLVLLLGLLSGMASGSSAGDPWYQMLAKPPFQPPGEIFGVVWTVLYVMMGIALAIVINARGAPRRQMAIWLFVVQLVLNLGWSPLFFAGHQLWPAFGLLVAIFFAALLTTLFFWRVRPLAGSLMLPYLAWLCFAGVLNYEIARMNPAGGQTPSAVELTL